jgi:predicted dehydrogenase
MEYWGLESGYADITSCRAATGMNFDVASICTPTEFHAGCVIELADDPVRLVFCEKPMAADYASASAAVAACDRAGKPLFVNYLRRWCSELSELADNLQSGRLGEVQCVSVRYAKGLVHGGSHALDLLHFFFGDLRVESILGTVDDGRTEDRTFNGLLRTEDEAPVFLIGSDYRKYSLFEIDITTSGGRVIIDNLGERLRYYAVRDSEEFPGHFVLHAERKQNIGLFFAMDRAMAGVYDTLSGVGASVTSTGHSALATHKTCDAIIRLAAD